MQDDTTNTDVVEEVVADEPQEQVDAPESTDTSQPEESQDNQEESEEAPEEAPQEEAPQGEEKPPSRRETLRIQSLLKKYGPPQERVQAPRQEVLDYQEALDADPEVIKRLEDDRNAAGQQQYNAGLEQAKSIQFHTRLEIDAPKVESKYEFLNVENKEKFHPALAEGINNLYLKFAGYDPGDPQRGVPESVQNPDIRYSDTVEMIMELADEIAVTRNTQTVKNLAKQAATTGLRPDGSSAKRLDLNKQPSDMSLEELYAAIGQRPPKK